MRSETFETPGPVTLKLDVPSGTIELETVDGGSTRVDVDGPDAEDFRIELRDRGGRSELVVDAPHKRLGLFAGDHRVTISTPHGADAQVKSGSADLEARGHYGAVEVQTGSGDVEVDSASTLRVKSGSGDVTARQVDGEASAVTGSGDVEIGRVGGEGTFRSGSGEVTVGEAGSDLTITTASGDQIIGSAASGRLKLRAASGDVRVGIRAGSRVFVDARSASGEMESDFELAGEPPPGDTPMVEVDATTASGDVRVTRA